MHSSRFGTRAAVCACATPPSAAVLLAVAISVAAGCADSGAEAGTHRISIHAFQYLPASDTVAVGDTVVWINQDAVPHTATAADRAWDTGSIATKQSGHVVVSKRGEHPYVCAFHPNMSGTLVAQ